MRVFAVLRLDVQADLDVLMADLAIIFEPEAPIGVQSRVQRQVESLRGRSGDDERA